MRKLLAATALLASLFALPRAAVGGEPDPAPAPKAARAKDAKKPDRNHANPAPDATGGTTAAAKHGEAGGEKKPVEKPCEPVKPCPIDG